MTRKVKDYVVQCFSITHPQGTDVHFEIYEEDDGKYFATAKGLGCSHSHWYWTNSVRELCDAHCLRQGAVR